MPSLETTDLIVDEFDASSVTKDEVVQSLIRNGGCIIRGVLSKEDVASIEKQVRPYIEADRAWDGGFFPPETRRVMGLAGKAPQFIELIPGNPLYRSVCDEFLTSRFECWFGSQKEVSVSEPQLNNTIVFSINPGARAQELHRDDMIHHNFQPAITSDQYKMGRDTGIGFFVAGKRTTKENGATRFVPRSHLQATDTPPNEADAVYAELEPGDGFIMLSSCYHGGSANMTENEERLVYSCFMTKGFLRQVSYRNIYSKKIRSAFLTFILGGKSVPRESY